jgi:uncharacterized protein YidB (DUF937 family)
MGLDDLLGSVLGDTGGTNPLGGLAEQVLPMLQGGGLADLLGKFGAAGLADKAASWVSTGENAQLSGAEVGAALGDDTVGDLAGRTGLSADEVSGGLAGLLPGLVDRLTPDGTLPGNLDLGQVAGSLGGLVKNLDLGKLLGK